MSESAPISPASDGTGGDPETTESSDVDEGQIAERLTWTPRERLQYLLDMLAFEDRARRATRLPREG